MTQEEVYDAGRMLRRLASLKTQETSVSDVEYVQLCLSGKRDWLGIPCGPLIRKDSPHFQAIVELTITALREDIANLTAKLTTLGVEL